MFSALPPLSTRQFEAVDARSLVPVVAWQPPNPVMLSCWLHQTSQDLQHVLERFAAECEAAWDENQHLQIRGHGSLRKRGLKRSSSSGGWWKRVFSSSISGKDGASPGLTGGIGAGPSSGGVQVSRGLVHE
ncbi:hypothetical protein L3Q82_017170 [Scortum barcoo]|uniref:Uncharacterized protein n=1 Tax=Scortum barcoo TaxID=214431 RepID=A0ACB8VKR0_9TELE|nr:hypothetical protein L3Q82_017170 [Scortum barcoo]